MKRISAIIYIVVGLLMVGFMYYYQDYAIYIGGILLSFVVLNAIVLYWYQGFKQKPMALMKFMGLNFSKDILWAVFWMYWIKDNAVLAVYVAGIFLLLSIPLYISVLKTVGYNQKSD